MSFTQFASSLLRVNRGLRKELDFDPFQNNLHSKKCIIYPKDEEHPERVAQANFIKYNAVFIQLVIVLLSISICSYYLLSK